MFLCIPMHFQFLWTKHPSWQKSCVYKCSVYHVHFPILFRCFSYPCVLRIMQAKWALTELLQLQVGVEGNFVWFVLLTWAAPSIEASTKPDITTPDRLSPPQISFLAVGTHRNGITIIDSADEPEEYTGREVALFCFCLCSAFLKLTCYFIVLFSSWTPNSGPN